MAKDVRTGAHLVRALRRANRAVEWDKERRLQAIGLTSHEYGALEIIAESPGQTGSNLAKELALPKHRADYLTARLQERELLERRHKDKHSLIRQLYLTEKGLIYLARADDAISRMETLLIKGMGEADSAKLRRLLENLAYEAARVLDR